MLGPVPADPVGPVTPIEPVGPIEPVPPVGPVIYSFRSDHAETPSPIFNLPVSVS